MKHPHAELMMQYAQDAMETDKPWDRWEYRLEGDAKWRTFNAHCPAWDADVEYRRKPRTIRIGEYDVPEPHRAPLDLKARYYIADPHNSCFADESGWSGDETDELVMQRGLVHLTRQAAEIHGRALASLTEQKP